MPQPKRTPTSFALAPIAPVDARTFIAQAIVEPQDAVDDGDTDVEEDDDEFDDDDDVADDENPEGEVDVEEDDLTDPVAGVTFHALPDLSLYAAYGDKDAFNRNILSDVIFTEAARHLTTSGRCHTQRAAVEILDDPPASQGQL